MLIILHYKGEYIEEYSYNARRSGSMGVVSGSRGCFQGVLGEWVGIRFEY